MNSAKNHKICCQAVAMLTNTKAAKVDAVIRGMIIDFAKNFDYEGGPLIPALGGLSWLGCSREWFDGGADGLVWRWMAGSRIGIKYDNFAQNIINGLPLGNPSKAHNVSQPRYSSDRPYVGISALIEQYNLTSKYELRASQIFKIYQRYFIGAWLGVVDHGRFEVPDIMVLSRTHYTSSEGTMWGWHEDSWGDPVWAIGPMDEEGNIIPDRRSFGSGYRPKIKWLKKALIDAKIWPLRDSFKGNIATAKAVKQKANEFFVGEFEGWTLETVTIKLPNYINSAGVRYLMNPIGYIEGGN